MNRAYKLLEFDKILEMLAGCAVSQAAKDKSLNLEPSLSVKEAKRYLDETAEAKKIIETLGNPPLAVMSGLEQSLQTLEKEALLSPEQLVSAARFIMTCRQMRNYLKKSAGVSPVLSSYAGSITDLSFIEDEIDRSIRGDRVDDYASSQLRDIRRKIDNMGMQIKSKLDSLLRANKKWFAEGFVSMRNGRYTLPVKREFKNEVSGSAVDISQSGGTVFIEPTAVTRMQEELNLLMIEEENEVRRVLYALCALLIDNLRPIRLNIEAMEILDFMFAKAKLALEMKAEMPVLSAARKIDIRSGRHPLLKHDTAVPLDFQIGDDITGVVITGPNTGGKTVSLKTIGLLSLMAQSGLFVPAAQGSVFTMNAEVLCDIGDGQSISENLSTFSAHMTAIIKILESAGPESLVLLDELGSGTDPAEGMGIAVSVLEELHQKGCLLVATTHYPEIKDFARQTEGFVNARMAFDRESLKPLYRLEIGEAGESCALFIAQRLGFPKKLADRAYQAAYISMSAQNGHLSFPMQSNRNEKKQPRPKKKVKDDEKVETEAMRRCDRFNIGDSVVVYPQKEIGIVYKKADEKGNVGVQIKRNKQLIIHKRLQLKVPASELYPPDYDFSIVFDTVANRKARHQMERKHDPNAIIKYEKGDEPID